VNPSDRAAVLWDLDGTLVDSAEYHWRSWRAIMAAEGLPLTYQQFLDCFGQKNDRILEGWLGEDATPERIARIADAKEVEYRRLARQNGLTPLPGAAGWTARLRQEGWLQALATSAPRANVDVMLEVLGFGGRFDAIVSAEDVTAGKPDPQVFLAAAGKLGVLPSRCLVVEDAAAGIEAARRAGMRTVGVSRTTQLEADLAVQSLEDLPEDAFSALLSRSNRE
jgi:HAD superfamily hydrolase (TIGR01509 family)